MFNPSRAYYTEDDVRVYTAAQLQKEGLAYYLKDSDTINFVSYGENDNSFSAQVKIYDSGIIKDLGYITINPEGNQITIEDKNNNITYTNNCEINTLSTTDIHGYTNAQL